MRHIVLVLVLVASTANADPMKREAREHFDRGTTLYRSGDYAGAIVELALGRQLDPRPDFLYALGQAYRKLGDCKTAVQHYEAFLDTHPAESEAAFVRANLARCEAQAEPQEITPVPAPEPPPIAVRPSPAREHDDRPAWVRDVPGGVLASAGLGGLAIGVTYLVRADRDIAAANTATRVSRLEELAASGHRERTIGTAFTLAGGAFAAGAALRYIIVGRRPRDHGIAVAADRTGAVAVWTGRF